MGRHKHWYVRPGEKTGLYSLRSIGSRYPEKTYFLWEGNGILRNHDNYDTAVKAVENTGEALCNSCLAPYSPDSMASVGQASAHAPQSVQSSGSMEYLSSPSLMASTGHSSMHVPQQMHSSVILYAIVLLSFHAILHGWYKK